MSTLEPSSPRSKYCPIEVTINTSNTDTGPPPGTGNITDNEEASQMEVPQGPVSGEAQSKEESPLMQDLIRRLQRFRFDEPEPLTGTDDDDILGDSDEEEVAEEVLEIKDGSYFQKLVVTEQCRLLALANCLDEYAAALPTDGSISEDIFGTLRSTSGSVRLLVKSKMNQFETLCQKNINPLAGEPFSITVDDLQGFWDMLHIQVVQMDAAFADIEQLKANNWRRAAEPSTSANPRARKVRPSSSSPLPASSVTDEEKSEFVDRRTATVKARLVNNNTDR